MRNPFTSPQWLLFIGALLVLFVLVEIKLIKLAAEKLGLPAEGMVLLLLVSLLGTAINMPLFRIRSAFDPANMPAEVKMLIDRALFTAGETRIAINVGGAVIPVCFSMFLLVSQALPLLPLLTGIAIITTISYLFSRPVSNLGITMPILIAPVSAALVAILLAPAERAAVAYISGTLGVLIGADLLRLRDIRQLAVPFASIGGAGTFDGIFLTGLVAVLLT